MSIDQRVPFTEVGVKAYLDKAIAFWRDRRDTSEDQDMASAHVDAFQSVRVSLFGELLAPNPPKLPPRKALRRKR